MYQCEKLQSVQKLNVFLLFCQERQKIQQFEDDFETQLQKVEQEEREKEEAEAATKIQAGFRGYKDRKRVNQLRDDSEV